MMTHFKGSILGQGGSLRNRGIRGSLVPHHA